MPTSRRGKRVRFAYNLHTFHPPGIPVSHSFHSSGIPASHSLGTPSPPSPIDHLPGLSYRTFPYASLSSVPRPHPLLEASVVRWDMIEHPSIITRNHLLPGRALHEPATTPPLSFLYISSVHLPWTIEVYASNGSYASVADVFDSIYQSLRLNITTTEFNYFPHWWDQLRATRAYARRYRRFRNIYGNDSEKRGGMKRIDFLMEHTKFQGISNTGHHQDKWQLNVLPLGT